MAGPTVANDPKVAPPPSAVPANPVKDGYRGAVYELSKLEGRSLNDPELDAALGRYLKENQPLAEELARQAPGDAAKQLIILKNALVEKEVIKAADGKIKSTKIDLEVGPFSVRLVERTGAKPVAPGGDKVGGAPRAAVKAQPSGPIISLSKTLGPTIDALEKGDATKAAAGFAEALAGADTKEARSAIYQRAIVLCEKKGIPLATLDDALLKAQPKPVGDAALSAESVFKEEYAAVKEDLKEAERTGKTPAEARMKYALDHAKAKLPAAAFEKFGIDAEALDEWRRTGKAPAGYQAMLDAFLKGGDQKLYAAIILLQSYGDAVADFRKTSRDCTPEEASAAKKQFAADGRKTNQKWQALNDAYTDQTGKNAQKAKADYERAVAAGKSGAELEPLKAARDKWQAEYKRASTVMDGVTDTQIKAAGGIEKASTELLHKGQMTAARVAEAEGTLAAQKTAALKPEELADPNKAPVPEADAAVAAVAKSQQLNAALHLKDPRAKPWKKDPALIGLYEGAYEGAKLSYDAARNARVGKAHAEKTPASEADKFLDTRRASTTVALDDTYDAHAASLRAAWDRGQLSTADYTAAMSALAKKALPLKKEIRETIQGARIVTEEKGYAAAVAAKFEADQKGNDKLVASLNKEIEELKASIARLKLSGSFTRNVVEGVKRFEAYTTVDELEKKQKALEARLPWAAKGLDDQFQKTLELEKKLTDAEKSGNTKKKGDIGGQLEEARVALAKGDKEYKTQKAVYDKRNDPTPPVGAASFDASEQQAMRVAFSAAHGVADDDAQFMVIDQSIRTLHAQRKHAIDPGELDETGNKALKGDALKRAQVELTAADVELHAMDVQLEKQERTRLGLRFDAEHLNDPRYQYDLNRSDRADAPIVVNLDTLSGVRSNPHRVDEKKLRAWHIKHDIPENVAMYQGRLDAARGEDRDRYLRDNVPKAFPEGRSPSYQLETDLKQLSEAYAGSWDKPEHKAAVAFTAGQSLATGAAALVEAEPKKATEHFSTAKRIGETDVPAADRAGYQAITGELASNALKTFNGSDNLTAGAAGDGEGLAKVVGEMVDMPGVPRSVKDDYAKEQRKFEGSAALLELHLLEIQEAANAAKTGANVAVYDDYRANIENGGVAVGQVFHRINRAANEDEQVADNEKRIDDATAKFSASSKAEFERFSKLTYAQKVAYVAIIRSKSDPSYRASSLVWSKLAPDHAHGAAVDRLWHSSYTTLAFTSDHSLGFAQAVTKVKEARAEKIEIFDSKGNKLLVSAFQGKAAPDAALVRKQREDELAKTNRYWADPLNRIGAQIVDEGILYVITLGGYAAVSAARQTVLGLRMARMGAGAAKLASEARVIGRVVEGYKDLRFAMQMSRSGRFVMLGGRSVYGVAHMKLIEAVQHGSHKLASHFFGEDDWKTGLVDVAGRVVVYGMGGPIPGVSAGFNGGTMVVQSITEEIVREKYYKDDPIGFERVQKAIGWGFLFAQVGIGQYQEHAGSKQHAKEAADQLAVHMVKNNIEVPEHFREGFVALQERYQKAHGEGVPTKAMFEKHRAEVVKLFGDSPGSKPIIDAYLGQHYHSALMAEAGFGKIDWGKKGAVHEKTLSEGVDKAAHKMVELGLAKDVGEARLLVTQQLSQAISAHAEQWLPKLSPKAAEAEHTAMREHQKMLGDIMLRDAGAKHAMQGVPEAQLPAARAVVDQALAEHMRADPAAKHRDALIEALKGKGIDDPVVAAGIADRALSYAAMQKAKLGDTIEVGTLTGRMAHEHEMTKLGVPAEIASGIAIEHQHREAISGAYRNTIQDPKLAQQVVDVAVKHAVALEAAPITPEGLKAHQETLIKSLMDPQGPHLDEASARELAQTETARFIRQEAPLHAGIEKTDSGVNAAKKMLAAHERFIVGSGLGPEHAAAVRTHIGNEAMLRAASEHLNPSHNLAERRVIMREAATEIGLDPALADHFIYSQAIIKAQHETVEHPEQFEAKLRSILEKEAGFKAPEVEALLSQAKAKKPVEPMVEAPTRAAVFPAPPKPEAPKTPLPIKSTEVGSAAASPRAFTVIDTPEKAAAFAGPDPNRTRPDQTAVAAVVAKLRRGEAPTPAEAGLLMAEVAFAARYTMWQSHLKEYNRSPHDDIYAADKVGGWCGFAQAASATYLTDLVPGAKVYPYQAGRIFGTPTSAAHAFLVVELPGGQRFLVDPTVRQFYHPGQAVEKQLGGVGLRTPADGAGVMDVLKREGFLPLTDHVARVYGETIGDKHGLKAKDYVPSAEHTPPTITLDHLPEKQRPFFPKPPLIDTTAGTAPPRPLTPDPALPKLYPVKQGGVSVLGDRVSAKLRGQELIDPRKLIPTEDFNRVGSTEKLAKYKTSFEKKGWDFSQEPIQVAIVDGQYYILNGHHRYQAATEAGLANIPIKIVDPRAYQWKNTAEIVKEAHVVRETLQKGMHRPVEVPQPQKGASFDRAPVQALHAQAIARTQAYDTQTRQQGHQELALIGYMTKAEPAAAKAAYEIFTHGNPRERAALLEAMARADALPSGPMRDRAVKAIEIALYDTPDVRAQWLHHFASMPHEQAGMLMAATAAGHEARVATDKAPPPQLSEVLSDPYRMPTWPNALILIDGQLVPVIAAEKAGAQDVRAKVQMPDGSTQEIVRPMAEFVRTGEHDGSALHVARGIGVAKEVGHLLKKVAVGGKEYAIVYNPQTRRFIVDEASRFQAEIAGSTRVMFSKTMLAEVSAAREHLSPQHQTQLDALLFDARSPEERMLLMRAFTAKARLGGLDNAMLGLSEAHQFRALARAYFNGRTPNPAELLRFGTADGLVQYYEHSCAITTEQYMRAQVSPLEAARFVLMGREGVLAEQAKALAETDSKVVARTDMDTRRIIGTDGALHSTNVAVLHQDGSGANGLSHGEIAQRLNRTLGPLLGNPPVHFSQFSGARATLEARLAAHAVDLPPEGIMISLRGSDGQHAVLVTGMHEHLDAKGETIRTYSIRDPAEPGAAAKTYTSRELEVLIEGVVLRTESVDGLLPRTPAQLSQTLATRMETEPNVLVTFRFVSGDDGSVIDQDMFCVGSRINAQGERELAFKHATSGQKMHLKEKDLHGQTRFGFLVAIEQKPRGGAVKEPIGGAPGAKAPVAATALGSAGKPLADLPAGAILPAKKGAYADAVTDLAKARADLGLATTVDERANATARIQEAELVIALSTKPDGSVDTAVRITRYGEEFWTVKLPTGEITTRPKSAIAPTDMVLQGNGVFALASTVNPDVSPGVRKAAEVDVQTQYALFEVTNGDGGDKLKQYEKRIGPKKPGNLWDVPVILVGPHVNADLRSVLAAKGVIVVRSTAEAVALHESLRERSAARASGAKEGAATELAPLPTEANKPLFAKTAATVKEAKQLVRDVTLAQIDPALYAYLQNKHPNDANQLSIESAGAVVEIIKHHAAKVGAAGHGPELLAALARITNPLEKGLFIRELTQAHTRGQIEATLTKWSPPVPTAVGTSFGAASTMPPPPSKPTSPPPTKPSAQPPTRALMDLIPKELRTDFHVAWDLGTNHALLEAAVRSPNKAILKALVEAYRDTPDTHLAGLNTLIASQEAAIKSGTTASLAEVKTYVSAIPGFVDAAAHAAFMGPTLAAGRNPARVNEYHERLRVLDEGLRSPRPLETVTTLAGIYAAKTGHPREALISPKLVKLLKDAVGVPRSSEPGALPLMSPHEAVRLAETLLSLDKLQVSTFVEACKDKSPEQVTLLLKTLAARTQKLLDKTELPNGLLVCDRAMTEVMEYAAWVGTQSHAALAGSTHLTGFKAQVVDIKDGTGKVVERRTVLVDGSGKQVYGTSCAPTTAIMAAAEHDPYIALLFLKDPAKMFDAQRALMYKEGAAFARELAFSPIQYQIAKELIEGQARQIDEALQGRTLSPEQQAALKTWQAKRHNPEAVTPGSEAAKAMHELTRLYQALTPEQKATLAKDGVLTARDFLGTLSLRDAGNDATGTRLDRQLRYAEARTGIHYEPKAVGPGWMDLTKAESLSKLVAAAREFGHVPITVSWGTKVGHAMLLKGPVDVALPGEKARSCFLIADPATGKVVVVPVEDIGKPDVVRGLGIGTGHIDYVHMPERFDPHDGKARPSLFDVRQPLTVLPHGRPVEAADAPFEQLEERATMPAPAGAKAAGITPPPKTLGEELNAELTRRTPKTMSDADRAVLTAGAAKVEAWVSARHEHAGKYEKNAVKAVYSEALTAMLGIPAKDRARAVEVAMAMAEVISDKDAKKISQAIALYSKLIALDPAAAAGFDAYVALPKEARAAGGEGLRLAVMSARGRGKAFVEQFAQLPGARQLEANEALAAIFISSNHVQSTADFSAKERIGAPHTAAELGREIASATARMDFEQKMVGLLTKQLQEGALKPPFLNLLDVRGAMNAIAGANAMTGDHAAANKLFFGPPPKTLEEIDGLCRLVSQQMYLGATYDLSVVQAYFDQAKSKGLFKPGTEVDAIKAFVESEKLTFASKPALGNDDAKFIVDPRTKQRELVDSPQGFALARSILEGHITSKDGPQFSEVMQGRISEFFGRHVSRAAFENLFCPTVPGYTAEIIAVDATSAQFHISVVIRDATGRAVGLVHRSAHKENTETGGEKLTWHNSSLHLDQDQHAAGIAKGLYAKTEAFLSIVAPGKETEIHLRANLTVGKYAWARAGYEFADARLPDEIGPNRTPKQWEKVRDDFLFLVEKHLAAQPEAIKARIREVIGLCRTPQDFASLTFVDAKGKEILITVPNSGEAKIENTPVGKAFFLDLPSGGWDAVKYPNEGRPQKVKTEEVNTDEVDAGWQ